MIEDSLVQHPMQVLAILLGVLAILFTLARTERMGQFFRFVPLLVFCYFVPSALSNFGVIPYEETFELYPFVKGWLLPASLFLLILSVDIPSILGLGRNALILFLTGTLTIVLGGPLAYAALGWMLPPELGDQGWRGLAALSGSWIGGGANYVAIGESVDASAATMARMVVVDVAVANTWMAVLLWFSGRQKKMDASVGADRSSIEALQAKVESFKSQVSRLTNLPDLLSMLALAFSATALARYTADQLPDVGDIIRNFTWVVIIVSTLALICSFTRLRRLEGAGASAVGSVFLYLLVATIGAKANFAEVAEAPELVAVGALWMLFHAALILIVWRILRAPIFFAAVGSQANVGGAASAPIVAAAFHPSLAPVGVLLAVGGYLLGTYAGIACAFLLEMVHGWLYSGVPA